MKFWVVIFHWFKEILQYTFNFAPVQPCYFFLWSRVYVILWLCYMTVTRPGHLMFIIYISHHACTAFLYMIYRLGYSCYCYYFQFSILSKILFLLFQCPTWTVTAFSYSLFYCSFISSCTLASPLLTDLYYFSVSRSESQYRELIMEHILIQLFSSEFSFISWLVPFRYCEWYYLCFSIWYMCFYPRAWVYMHICVLSYLLLTA